MLFPLVQSSGKFEPKYKLDSTWLGHKPKLCLGSFAITSFPQMVITNAEKDIAIDLKSVVQVAVDQTSRGLLKRTNLESDKSIKL